jgi:hypothetical protein
VRACYANEAIEDLMVARFASTKHRTDRTAGEVEEEGFAEVTGEAVEVMVEVEEGVTV